ncbi:hypothetical protein H6G64_14100 [Calothrix sp. FACHB-156]|nr:hypothetical protein [Nostoc linckia FACHB-104]MBD2338107.1 hypothetical protein [Calothrix sp. FACHB-156]
MAGEIILKQLRFSVGDRFFVEAAEARGDGRADTSFTSSPPKPLCYFSFFPLS